jgi:hypothetical protein
MPGVFVLAESLEETKNNAVIAFLGSKPSLQQRQSFEAGFLRVFSPSVRIFYSVGLAGYTFQVTGDQGLLDEYLYNHPYYTFGVLKTKFSGLRIVENPGMVGATYALFLRCLTEHGSSICENSDAVTEFTVCVPVLYNMKAVDGKQVNVDTLSKIVIQNKHFFTNVDRISTTFSQ